MKRNILSTLNINYTLQSALLEVSKTVLLKSLILTSKQDCLL